MDLYLAPKGRRKLPDLLGGVGPPRLVTQVRLRCAGSFVSRGNLRRQNAVVRELVGKSNVGVPKITRRDRVANLSIG